MNHQPIAKATSVAKSSSSPHTFAPESPVVELTSTNRLSPAQILQMQRLVGNRAVQRMLSSQHPVRRDAAPAADADQRQAWDAMMAEDVAQLMELREQFQAPFDVLSSSAGDKVVEIFQKWKNLDTEHQMNNALLRRFAYRVSAKTFMVSKMLGLAEEMTNLLDHLKRHLNLARFALLSAMLTPVGMGQAAEELVSFGEILVETTVEFIVNSPYFALGVVKGAWQSLEDLVAFFGDIAKTLVQLVQDPSKLIDDAKELLEDVKKLDLKALGSEFWERWNDNNARKRAEFQGFVLGYIEMEILFAGLTAGASVEAKAGSKFAKLAELLRNSKRASVIIERAKPVLKAVKKTAGVAADVAGGGMGALGATMEDEQNQAQEGEEIDLGAENEDDPYILMINEGNIELTEDTESGGEVQRLIRRAPQPGVKPGLKGERQIMDKLLKGEVPGMPKMKHVVDATYNGVNGIDIIAVEVRGDQRILHVVEVKGGFASDLKDTLNHGFQMSEEWVTKVVKKALANADVANELKAVTRIADRERLFKKIVNARRYVVASENRNLTKLLKSIRRIRKNPPKLIKVPPRRRIP